MKFWKSAVIVALGAIAPGLAYGQDPWAAPGYGQSGQHAQYAMPGQYEPGAYDQLLPPRGTRFDYDDSQRITLREAFAESFVRLEYVNWKTTGAKGKLLGAPNSSGADLSGNTRNNRLDAEDPTTGAVAFTEVIVPRLSDSSRQMDGLRATWGIPTNAGTLETEIFYFAKAKEEIRIDPFVDSFSGTTIIGGVTLLNNGQISPNTMILFSEGYQALHTTSLYGSEMNWVFNPFVPNVGVEVSPILGFRFMHLDDHLTISGSNVQSSTITLDHFISSTARNNIFGPQVGLRTSARSGRFEFGTETKFMPGINRLAEAVYTREILNPETSTDPNQPVEANRTIKDTRTRFAPIFDIALTGKFDVTPNFKVFASYELLLGGGFSRSFNNIDYNSPASVNLQPEINLKPKLTGFMAHGFAVGGEYTYR